MFKNGIPELLLENQAVVDKIIMSAIQGDTDDSLTMGVSLIDFFKCIGKLTSKDFEEKIDLFFKVI